MRHVRQPLHGALQAGGGPGAGGRGEVRGGGRGAGRWMVDHEHTSVWMQGRGTLMQHIIVGSLDLDQGGGAGGGRIGEGGGGLGGGEGGLE